MGTIAGASSSQSQTSGSQGHHSLQQAPQTPPGTSLALSGTCNCFATTPTTATTTMSSTGSRPFARAPGSERSAQYRNAVATASGIDTTTALPPSLPLAAEPRSHPNHVDSSPASSPIIQTSVPTTPVKRPGSPRSSCLEDISTGPVSAATNMATSEPLVSLPAAPPTLGNTYLMGSSLVTNSASGFMTAGMDSSLVNSAWSAVGDVLSGESMMGSSFLNSQSQQLSGGFEMLQSRVPSSVDHLTLNTFAPNSLSQSASGMRSQMQGSHNHIQPPPPSIASALGSVQQRRIIQQTPHQVLPQQQQQLVSSLHHHGPGGSWAQLPPSSLDLPAYPLPQSQQMHPFAIGNSGSASVANQFALPPPSQTGLSDPKSAAAAAAMAAMLAGNFRPDFGTHSSTPGVTGPSSPFSDISGYPEASLDGQVARLPGFRHYPFTATPSVSFSSAGQSSMAANGGVYSPTGSLPLSRHAVQSSAGRATSSPVFSVPPPNATSGASLIDALAGPTHGLVNGLAAASGCQASAYPTALTTLANPGEIHAAFQASVTGMAATQSTPAIFAQPSHLGPAYPANGMTRLGPHPSQLGPVNSASGFMSHAPPGNQFAQLPSVGIGSASFHQHPEGLVNCKRLPFIPYCNL
ncbi:unnamed protein product [Protopolystoma xenopodis]|uniref:Uncharacterized protein n=1 Tax=Protopolystoma xenopodis TaxID=117903 RepID=A0A3S5A1I3_9PLAT|nr:unnamed protein product [Protopolystoma xenopodis]